MRHILIFLLCFVLAGLLLVANSGRADDAPIEITGGAASPIAFPHQSIRMDSEEATIRLHKKSYTVDAVFRFFNTGETLTEWVGFPKRSMGYDFFPSADFIQFETWVNDQKVQFSEKSDFLKRVRMFLSYMFSDPQFIKYDRWLVKQVTFSGHGTTTTRVRYEVEYHRMSDADFAHYIYGTGSHWKDNIGVAVFTVDGTDIDRSFSVKFRGRRFSEKVVRCEAMDFKPGYDDQLTVQIDR